MISRILKIVLFTLILLPTISFLSCSNDENDTPVVVDPVEKTGCVQISLYNLVNVSNQLEQDSCFDKPDSVYLTIKNGSGQVVINHQKFGLKKVDNSYVSDSLFLESGFYSIENLEVVSKDSTLLYLTPRKGSVLSSKVLTPLRFSFESDTTSLETVRMQVLPVTHGTPDQFGYSSTFKRIKSLVLQPDSVAGKDAFVYSTSPDTNLGKRDMLEIMAWKFTTPQIVIRSFLDFETSSLPAGTKIIKSTLHLYEYHTSIVPSGGHYHLEGSNESYIQRVTSPWLEDSITWNNQPGTSPENQVIIKQDTAYNQNDSIDMTQLMNDQTALPVNNRHGFMLSLKTETGRRALIFGSSDTADKTKRPKLVIYYKQ